MEEPLNKENESTNTTKIGGDEVEYKVYCYRYVILFSFLLNSIAGSLYYVSISPIQADVIDIYDAPA